jgi:ATP-dependent Clp protease ATP-binding subunit ClpB
MNFEKYTHAAQKRLSETESLAFGAKHSTLEPVHLLSAMLAANESVVPDLLKSAGADTAVLGAAMKARLDAVATITGSTAHPALSPELRQTLDSAEKLAAKMGDEYVTEEHLLLALASSSTLESAFKTAGTDSKKLQKAYETLAAGERVTSPDAEELRGSLSKFTIDLVDLARKGKIDPVIGREDEIRRTIQILSRRTKNNPVLIGDPGVGKTAIVEGIARKIVDGEVPDALKNKRLLTLDL